MNFSQGNHKLRMKNVYERENPILKNRKDHNSAVQLRSFQFFSYGHLSDFLKSYFLFHIHFSVVICDFLVITYQCMCHLKYIIETI